MNYVVLDMEWNQRIKSKRRIKTPVALIGEIIQIGAVKLNESFCVTDTFKIAVTPKYYTHMHAIVSEITKITDKDLQCGLPFNVAFEQFRKWCGDEFILLTWGYDDVNILRDNMLLHKLDVAWIPPTYNLQVIFDNQISKEHRQVSLSAAMEMVNETALDAHDALNDAKNTAQICLHLDMEKGLAEYAVAKKSMSGQSNKNTAQKRPDKCYPSKKKALEDPEVISFSYDGEQFTCAEFVEQNNAKYMAVASNEEGRELFVRFKFRRWGSKEYSVSRVVYEMDETHRSYYDSRKKRAGNRTYEKRKKRNPRSAVQKNT